jgi:hypothetical protein
MIDIKTEMQALDSKNRNFYKSLSDEDKKKFSNYLMIRWGSCVAGSNEMQEYYILSCNERLNKHFFDLNKHPELLWLLTTTISPGCGNQRHNWIGLKKRESSNKKLRVFLEKQFPLAKPDELDLLEAVNVGTDFKDLAKQCGFSDVDIKRELG